ATRDLHHRPPPRRVLVKPGRGKKVVLDRPHMAVRLAVDQNRRREILVTEGTHRRRQRSPSRQQAGVYILRSHRNRRMIPLWLEGFIFSGRCTTAHAVGPLRRRPGMLYALLR